jgi:histone H3/H4
LALPFSTIFCRTFKQIEEASQKLLAKNPFARFADKGKDSKVVAGLVQRLREAIVRYQVSD